MSTNVHVAGVDSTKFGLHPGRTLQSFAIEAARAALSDSNVRATGIVCLFVGNFVGGMTSNACSTDSTAPTAPINSHVMAQAKEDATPSFRIAEETP
jgi:acetyl-CoA acetyltransferase